MSIAAGRGYSGREEEVAARIVNEQRAEAGGPARPAGGTAGAAPPIRYTPQ